MNLTAIAASGLAKGLWNLVSAHSTYTKNRTHYKALNGTSPISHEVRIIGYTHTHGTYGVLNNTGAIKVATEEEDGDPLGEEATEEPDNIIPTPPTPPKQPEQPPPAPRKKQRTDEEWGKFLAGGFRNESADQLRRREPRRSEQTQITPLTNKPATPLSQLNGQKREVKSEHSWETYGYSQKSTNSQKGSNQLIRNGSMW